MSGLRIAIIGPGNVGRALAGRFLDAGNEVVFGHRADADPSEAIASTGGRATAAPSPEAVKGADLVVLTVPGTVAPDVAASLGDLSGCIVVDATNPIRWDNGPVWSPPAAGSNAEAIAARLPGAAIVKGFNTFGAEFHADPNVGGRPLDVFVASDALEAKHLLAALSEPMGFRVIDAGPLRNASVLENTAVLWIHLAIAAGRGRDFAIMTVDR